MSHFTTLVITRKGQDPEELLAGFDENMEMPRYVEYTKGQLIAKGKKEIEEYKNTTYAEYLKDPAAYEENCKSPEHLKYVSKEFPKKLGWTEEQIYEDELGYYENKDIGKDGEVYSRYNPDSKWDWYQLGGRWSESLLAKKGKKGNLGERSWANREDKPKEGWYDQLKFGDIDFERMKDIQAKEAELTWLKAEGSSEEDRYWKFDIENGETKKDFLKRKSEFSTFAVVTPDGGWYEKGGMGWWGTVNNKKEEDVHLKNVQKILKSCKPDDLFSIYDLHI